MLQIVRFIVAPNCGQMKRAETSLYAHRTPTLLTWWTTTGQMFTPRRLRRRDGGSAQALRCHRSDARGFGRLRPKRLALLL